VGTAVGNFSTTDLDIGNTFTYTLVSGSGGADNASFTISGNTLQSSASFDFEFKSSYSIRVRTTDQGSLWFEKVFAISVLDTNETPAQPVNLSPAAGAQDQPLDPTLQASPFSDPDAGDSQAASEWLVRRTADNALIFDSGEDKPAITPEKK